MNIYGKSGVTWGGFSWMSGIIALMVSIELEFHTWFVEIGINGESLTRSVFLNCLNWHFASLEFSAR